jgi:hypothetical protein
MAQLHKLLDFRTVSAVHAASCSIRRGHHEDMPDERTALAAQHRLPRPQKPGASVARAFERFVGQSPLQETVMHVLLRMSHLLRVQQRSEGLAQRPGVRGPPLLSSA